MKILRNILIILFVVICTAIIGGYFIAGVSYSKGDRAGYLFKISEKGFLFKTYEGELNLGGMNTQSEAMVGKIWNFSVRRNNTAVYDKLVELQGKRVKVHYSQPFKVFFWQGESEYFVDDVSEIK